MKWVLASISLAAASAAHAATPLFASDEPIMIGISGPIGAISGNAEDSTAPRPATLSAPGEPAAFPIRLAARGITRRKSDICQFPPLRVEFLQPPPASSLFAGQRRLKLVTHCRNSEGFQQYLLLEYSAYRIFNLISPVSFRARLARVNYTSDAGRAVVSRYGFFIEDKDDVARRNGLREARTGDRIAPSQLEPRQAARFALFEYMIGNLDWSMRAGPAGQGCCHNGRLLTGTTGQLIAFPYDFDYSGLVDAPYAVPPEGFGNGSVRNRIYRGYCSHNAEAIAAAAEIRALRPQIEGLFGQIPGLEDRTRRKTLSYLGQFFAQIATNDSVRKTILKGCLG
jgi:hypothetical protein